MWNIFTRCPRYVQAANASTSLLFSPRIVPPNFISCYPLSSTHLIVFVFIVPRAGGVLISSVSFALFSELFASIFRFRGNVSLGRRLPAYYFRLDFYSGRIDLMMAGKMRSL